MRPSENFARLADYQFACADAYCSWATPHRKIVVEAKGKNLSRPIVIPDADDTRDSTVGGAHETLCHDRLDAIPTSGVVENLVRHPLNSRNASSWTNLPATANSVVWRLGLPSYQTVQDTASISNT